MRTAAAATALAVAMGAGAAGVHAQGVPASRNVTKTLVKSEAQKECFTLVSSQVLYYRFRSDVPLDFKLSHQEDKEIVHVERSQVADGAGSYVPKKASDYCLVWTNAGDRSATLHYEIERVSQ